MKSKIGSNIIALYLRMLFILVLNLFTVRLVYNTLGEEDYGLFILITGIVVMFQSISTVVSTATQRFYSFNIGLKNYDEISRVFSASINIYFIFSIFCLVVAETVGLWFINNKLTIPVNKSFETNWIYQLSVFTFLLSIIQIPYSAAIIAEEDMNYYAIISVIDAIFKLISIIIISHVLKYKLILYTFALLCISMFSLTAYVLICRKKYRYYKYRTIKDRKLYKNLLSFSGWNFFGSFAGVGINQIGTILIDIFFGLCASAARGISLQVNSALSQLSNTFITAVKPPIIKAYAERNHTRLELIFSASNKCVYYLMQIIVIPLYINMGEILKIWLKSDDSQTILFSRLMVIYVFILSLHNPLTILIQAIGKLKNYYLYSEIPTLLCPIVTLLLYRKGLPVQSIYYVMIGTITVAQIVRVWCVKTVYQKFNVLNYFLSFLVPAILNTIVTIVTVEIYNHVYGNNVLISIIISIIVTILQLLLYGLSKKEKIVCVDIAKSIIRR